MYSYKKKIFLIHIYIYVLFKLEFSIFEIQFCKFCVLFRKCKKKLSVHINVCSCIVAFLMKGKSIMLIKISIKIVFVNLSKKIFVYFQNLFLIFIKHFIYLYFLISTLFLYIYISTYLILRTVNK